MAEITRETIIEAAKHVAATVGGPISLADFERLSRIGQHVVYRLFPEGGWSEVKRLAGLERHPKDNESLSDEDVLAEYHRVASEVGRIPTWATQTARPSDASMRKVKDGSEYALSLSSTAATSGIMVTIPVDAT